MRAKKDSIERRRTLIAHLFLWNLQKIYRNQAFHLIDDKILSLSLCS